MIHVMMGITGSGKSTVGRLLADRLGVPFVEGDDWHPAENIAKMSAGIPLTDEDRRPWLDRLAAAIADWSARREGVVVSCSALKRDYRRILAGSVDDLVFVHLAGDPDILRRRMQGRRGHFMPTTLFDSQLATLEPPVDEPNVIEVDADDAPAAIVDTILRRLDQRRHGSARPA